MVAGTCSILSRSRDVNALEDGDKDVIETFVDFVVVLVLVVLVATDDGLGDRLEEVTDAGLVTAFG